MPEAIKYLFSMKRLPLLLVMLAVGIFLAFRTMGTGNTIPPTKYERILQSVAEILVQGHFKPKDINDDFSRKVFVRFLEELDPEKNVLLQQDINELKKYEKRVDDELKGQPVEFFLHASRLFNKRVEEASKIYKDLLSQPFDFSKDEVFVTDPKKLSFASTPAQQKEQWRKKLKFLALERFVELQDIREKNKGNADFVVRTDAELEKEARLKVEKIVDRLFDRYRFKFNDDDKFSLYVNAITQTMDP